MPENELLDLNPQIKEISIGVRDLRKVKIYPPSLADQIKLMNIISQGFATWIDQNPNSEEITIESVAGIMGLVQAHIHDVLKTVFALSSKKEVDKYLSEITNYQLAQIIKIVIEDNYLGPVKNVKSLFEKEEDLEKAIESLSGRPSRQSAKSTDISSNTSSG
jgi:hypothetical protein